MKLLIYSEFTSPRLHFVCQQLFYVWYGWEYCITTDSQFFIKYEGASLNYSKDKLKNKEILIPCTNLLRLDSIQTLESSNLKYIKIPAFFKSEAPTALDGDLLSTIFLFLSRYEEYLSYTPDQHDRFPATQSWAYQFGYLHLPVIDIWLNTLHHTFRQLFSDIPPLKRSFRKLITYDIDLAWAYLHKGFMRNIGSMAKVIWQRDWETAKRKMAVTRRQTPDPYDTFPLFDLWSQQYQITPIYFFLLGNYGQYDKNISPSNPHFQQLIRRIATQYPIGIHPSYLSNSQPTQLATEIEILSRICQQPIINSRQHFLKLHLPITYRQLLRSGIQHDYSMGYADAIGFRAGTSLPFYWYDLEKEETTNLLIHPFQIMDVTLKEYLNLSPKEAKVTIKEMIDVTKAVNGIFCSLWHNSSFSYIGGWQEWKAVYELLLKY